MKQKKSGAAMGALLMGLLLCTAGCATETSASVTETEEQSSMELPPLVTTALAEETDVSATETQLSTEIKQVPLFSGEISDWELPAELGTLQSIRFSDGKLYLLGVQQQESGQGSGVLFCTPAQAEPEFQMLYPDADPAGFSGLTNFDVLSDGTVCGLICQNATEIPYEDSDFDPDTFDWETYYENYATQYHLVWYDAAGTVIRKMGLSTLLHLDQESKQTMVFTSVRCDAADHIYLTATIDEQEYLMALDSQGNLCPVQGYSTDMLEVASAFQWVRSSTGGMLLLEQDANGSSALSHIVVTDGALWKTQVTLADACGGDSLLGESDCAEFWYGVAGAGGLYGVASQQSQAELLYTWGDLSMKREELEHMLLLPDQCAVAAVYTTRGDLALELISPKVEEPGETESTATEETVPDTATPVQTLQ